MLRKRFWHFLSSLKFYRMSEALTLKDVPPGEGMKEGNQKNKRTADDSSNELPIKKSKGTPPESPSGRTDRKRKVALLMAYSGEGYYGIQVNPTFPTIESELFKALVKVGLVPQEHVDSLSKMSFQRAARTDKGVSAIGQVVSLKMLLNVENLVDELNKSLPQQIKILGFKRTTNSFNSKNHCSHRTYIYMMPTYALSPVEQNITQEYRIKPERLDLLNEVLSNFKGTHNFHNFTSGKKHSDPSATRYIIEFKAGQPIVENDMEFLTITVKGQSFMLHQIRKMIGLAIAIVRGFCGVDVIDLAWKPEKVDIPKAPGVGLVLDKLHYDGYNKKFGNDGIHDPLVWDEYQEEMEKFKKEFILSNIIKKEREELVMQNWLVTLHNHSFGSVEDEEERYRTGCNIAAQKLKKIHKDKKTASSSEAELSDTEINCPPSKSRPQTERSNAKNKTQKRESSLESSNFPSAVNDVNNTETNEEENLLEKIKT